METAVPDGNRGMPKAPVVLFRSGVPLQGGRSLRYPCRRGDA